MANDVENFRNMPLNEPRLFSSPNIMQTPLGNVRRTASSPAAAPLLPPRPLFNQQPQIDNSYNGGMMGCSPFASAMGPGYSFGGGFGSYSPGYGGGFGPRYRGGGYGAYSKPRYPENRFIQLAEESSRPAFQSIGTVVGTIGNFAAMLDSMFFALRRYFRAILGVASNFRRLRGVFAQLWSTFAVFRGLNWLYKKLLYWLKISNIDPSTQVFKEAFEAARQNLPPNPYNKKQSPWPIIIFLGFIFSAPYLVMKLLGSVTQSALEESKNPKTWVQPIASQVNFDFQARNPQELSILAGQTVLVAPKEVQKTHKLMNTGWALATLDRQISGLIPKSYVQRPNQAKREQQTSSMATENVTNTTVEPQIYSGDPFTYVQGPYPANTEQRTSYIPTESVTNAKVEPQIYSGYPFPYVQGPYPANTEQRTSYIPTESVTNAKVEPQIYSGYPFPYVQGPYPANTEQRTSYIPTESVTNAKVGPQIYSGYPFPYVQGPYPANTEQRTSYIPTESVPKAKVESQINPEGPVVNNVTKDNDKNVLAAIPEIKEQIEL